MPPLATFFGSPTQPGVSVVEPKAVNFDIHDQVMKSLEGVPAGQTMAVVRIQTGQGVNLAIAHKFNDAWSAEVFIGKSGWQAPISGGAQVVFSR